MEQKNQKAAAKKANPQKSIRIGAETERKLGRLLNSANKKKFGRKIKCDQLLNLALDLVTDDNLRTLQETSLTNEDRKEQLRQSYIQEVGPISKDAFTGFMLTEEFQKFMASHRTAQIVAPTISVDRAS